MLFPPSGSAHDDYNTTRASQRAIVYQALVDTPRTLADAIRVSHTWGEVVAYILRDKLARREELAKKEGHR